MALEALSSNELLNFIIHDTFSATPNTCNDSNSETNSICISENAQKAQPQPQPQPQAFAGCCLMTPLFRSVGPETVEIRRNNLAVRKKRRRKPRGNYKNKEEAETQRMTHIAVERNRRKQMNDHLAVLRSLMPQSYVQRGDQASIVGGAIEFVKELEHLLQSLETQKFLKLQEGGRGPNETTTTTTKFLPTPFPKFFQHPDQYTCSQIPNKYTSKSNAAVADIAVTLIETHANLRILSRRQLRQLSKMIVDFQTLHLTILHLNITTLDSLVLYSISAKLEEGCQLNSSDDIAAAVHHMLRIIEEEANQC